MAQLPRPAPGPTLADIQAADRAMDAALVAYQDANGMERYEAMQALDRAWRALQELYERADAELQRTSQTQIGGVASRHHPAMHWPSLYRTPPPTREDVERQTEPAQPVAKPGGYRWPGVK